MAIIIINIFDISIFPINGIYFQRKYVSLFLHCVACVEN